MNVSAASLAPDSSVRKVTPSDNTERTARSGAVVETIILSRPLRAQCIGAHATRQSASVTGGIVYNSLTCPNKELSYEMWCYHCPCNVCVV